jgi:hypothetical protein
MGATPEGIRARVLLKEGALSGAGPSRLEPAHYRRLSPPLAAPFARSPAAVVASTGTMDTPPLNERDICTKCITPAIQEAGWELHQFRQEVNLTEGRVIVRGKLAARVRNPTTVRKVPLIDQNGSATLRLIGVRNGTVTLSRMTLQHEAIRRIIADCGSVTAFAGSPVRAVRL